MSTQTADQYTITERPITGDLTQTRVRVVDQINKEEFLGLIDAVFAYPQVESIQWQQYTPYFNDGEECVFSIHEVFVKVTGVAEDAGDYEDGYLAGFDLNPKYRGGQWDDGSLPESAWEVGPALVALSNSSETWENVARQNFGDHAEVTATREGFNVEYYEHD